MSEDKDRVNKRICPRCQSYMQLYPDQQEPFHPFRWLKCSCGYTTESGEYLPKVPTEKEINDKLKEVEDAIIK